MKSWSLLEVEEDILRVYVMRSRVLGADGKRLHSFRRSISGVTSVR
jgi:hypothetical protein